MSDFNNTGDHILEVFLFEMSSLLDQLDDTLLVSERNHHLTEDDINEIFRAMHTIKGSSSMMEFNLISTLTHKLEDCFFQIREKGIAPQYLTQLFDLMLDASDFLRSQLEAIQSGTPLAENNPELVERVNAMFQLLKEDPSAAAPAAPAEPVAAPAAPPAPPPQTPVPAAAPSPQPPAAPQAPAQADDWAKTYQVNVLFEEDCGMENLRALMLVNSLGEKCNIISFDPADIETNPDTASYILINGFSIVLESEMEQEALQQIVDHSLHVKTASILPAVGGQDHGANVEQCYSILVRFEEDCGVENLRAFMLVNALQEKCEVLGYTPENIEYDSTTAAVILRDGFSITVRATLSQIKLQEILDNSMYVKSARLSLAPEAERESLDYAAALAPQAHLPAPAELQPEPLPAPPAPSLPEPAAPPAPVYEAPAAVEPADPPQPPAGEGAQAAAAQVKAAQSSLVSGKAIRQNLINVSLSKLDELMDLMGELVITESMVTRNPDLQGIPKLDNFQKAARQLRKLIDELQDMVMSVRMIPVVETFSKMHRVVRDMSRTLGKEAELVTLGEETDIDKAIIDTISDPIMHLVRNAMDHGVESPKERLAAGKPARATITLAAENTGGEILITVSDDGKGLDAQKILRKAKASGILTKSVDEYTDREAFQLLLLPGFSTKEQVTEYSGRGVGLDVVKKNIEKIGGNAIIESEKGNGMSVYLKIPLTLAIVDGMELGVGDSIYTLPITDISESFKAKSDQVFFDPEGNEMIVLRGDVYPIIRLHRLYNVPGALTDIEDGILIWVQSGDRSACLFVDRLIGEQQIVVKPLPVYLSNYDIKSYGISGCTILGDGNISLILDAGSIIDKITDNH